MARSPDGLSLTLPRRGSASDPARPAASSSEVASSGGLSVSKVPAAVAGRGEAEMKSGTDGVESEGGEVEEGADDYVSVDGDGDGEGEGEARGDDDSEGGEEEGEGGEDADWLQRLSDISPLWRG